MLTELLADVPRASGLEATDLVVTHGFTSIVIDLPMDPWRLEFYRLLDEFF